MDSSSPAKPLISTHTFAFSFHLITQEPDAPDFDKSKCRNDHNVGESKYSKTVGAALGRLKHTYQVKGDARESQAEKPIIGQWRSSDFHPWSSAAAYNEFQYFYKQVLETIYTTKDKLSGFGYAYQVFNFQCEDVHRVFTLHLNSGTKAVLDIDEIHLSMVHIAEDKYTGVLTLHTSNRIASQSDPELLLEINQQARQLYPSTYMYEGKVKPGIGLDLEYTLQKEGNTVPSEKEGLDNDVLGIPKSASFLSENWQQWLFMTEQNGVYRPEVVTEKKAPYDYGVHATIPVVLYQLIRSGFHSMLQEEPVPNSMQDFPLIYAVGDARMHVHSYIGNKQIAGEIAVDAKNPPLDFSWRGNFVYRAVHLDEKWATHTYQPVITEKLIAQTDSRWAAYGTLYGFTSYSSIMLSNAYANLGPNGYLVWVFRGAYYTMVQTVLLQRAAIRLMSHEVNKFHRSLAQAPKNGREASSENDFNVDHEKVINLLASFTRFREQLIFTKLTAQDQGSDYYEHLQRAFGVKELLAELESELTFMANQSELQYDYEQAVAAKQRAASSERISKVINILTAVALVPSLMFSFYGLNVIGMDKLEISPVCFLMALLCAVFCAWIFMKTISAVDDSGEHQKGSMMKRLLLFAGIIFFMSLPWICSSVLIENNNKAKVPNEAECHVANPPDSVVGPSQVLRDSAHVVRPKASTLCNK